MLREFDAVVTAVRESGGAPWAALDATAFYPAGGGQPSDRGWIGDIAVSDLTDEDGVVWHRLEKPLSAGAAVACRLDFERRFDHMQQHTGQHILSRAFVEVAGADTLSFHLGEAETTIDVSHAGPESELLRRVEDRANEIIWEDREVKTHVVTREEAVRFSLRKPPDVEGPVRVVEVSGFDWSACGGTHVPRSGQVGLLAILRTERYKGGTRISFAAGGRALGRLRRSGDLLRLACLEFTSGESDLLAGIGRLKKERERLERRLKPLLKESLEHEAARLLSEAPRGAHGPVVACHFLERDPEEAGILAAILAARGAVALLVSGDAGSTRAHFSAPPGTMSMGALLGEVCRKYGGRGGGRPESAQGTLPDGAVSAALDSARQAALAGDVKGASTT
jgi:alanyl-tRNA synthetase